MRIGLLGPVEAHTGHGRAVTPAGPRLRALLAVLALHPGRPVGTDRIIADLWGDTPPAGPAKALQILVSRLRRALPDTTIDSTPAGYRLAVDADDVDTHRFATLAADGRHRLRAGDPAGAATTLTDALHLWRGPALADVTAPFAEPVAARLDTHRLDTVADLAEAHLAAGHPDTAAALLAEPAAEHPLSERLCALRVRALHAAGHQAEALTCYQTTRHALADQLGVDPGPELAAVHLAVLRGAPTDPPRTPRTNLRAPLSSFIGRDREVRDIRRLLTGTRLVTLVGPGGTGKTRLAGEAATGLLPTTPDGVWLVELAPVSDPHDLPNAVLTALGHHLTATLHTPTTTPGRAEQLHTLLADRRALIILDNCEHLVDAAARLADTLLAHCPGIRILATSRAALTVTGERLYPVPPLDPPADGADLATTRRSPAVQLLTDRASAVRPGFTVDHTNQHAVAAICRRLDGAPLALELAAARLRALTPADLADRLDDRFRILTAGNRAALPRHQTLRAVVGWSWDLLDDAQRTLARRLSVFAGGATLAAVHAVCADPRPGGTLPADAVLDALTGLVDQSLVEADDRPTTRYRMLDTIRAYGAEQLAAADETTTIRRAHLAYHLHLAETTEPALRTRDQDRAVATFTAEHDNTLAALRHAIDTRDTTTGLRLGAALVWYWLLHGYAVDGGPLLRELLHATGDTPPPGHAGPYVICYIAAELSHTRDVFTDPDELAPRVRHLETLAATALAEPHTSPLVRLLRVFPPAIRGDLDTARTLLDPLATDPDPWIRATSLLLRAHLLADTTGVDTGARDAAAAVTAYRQLGERWGLSMALVGYGELLVMTGDLHHGADILTEAWNVARHIIPEPERPSFLVRLAGIRCRAGDVDTAERELAHAARLRDQHPSAANRFDWFEYDIVEGDIHRRRGRAHAARAAYRRVQHAAARRPNTPPQLHAIALAGIAAAERDLGDHPAATDAVHGALRALAPTRDIPVIVVVLQSALLVAAATGDHHRVAVLTGAMTTLQRNARHGPDLTTAIDTARAALPDHTWRAAHHHGTTLDFAGLYRYFGIPTDQPPTHQP